MRIGVDARCLSGPLTGIGRYVREILLRLDARIPDAEWVLYSRHPITLSWPSARWIVRVEPSRFWRRLPGTVWIKVREPKLIRRDDIDLFWAAATLAPRVHVPVVSTVYDLNHLLVPETMPWVNRFTYRRWFSEDVERAAKVVTISRGTTERLRTLLGREADAIAVPGSRWASMQHASTNGRLIEESYILAVGTREPRKNIDSLVQAVAQLKAKGELREHALVIVGAKGWGRTMRSNAHGQTPWLRELGYVPDDSMSSLFANADLLVQPSIYEGFGMPAAEAASFGTRVLATDIPELREAAGPEATFVQPDADSIGRGILLALSAPKPESRIAQSWDAAARVMRDILLDAAGVSRVS